MLDDNSKTRLDVETVADAPALSVLMVAAHNNFASDMQVAERERAAAQVRAYDQHRALVRAAEAIHEECIGKLNAANVQSQPRAKVLCWLALLGCAVVIVAMIVAGAVEDPGSIWLFALSSAGGLLALNCVLRLWRTDRQFERDKKNAENDRNHLRGLADKGKEAALANASRAFDEAGRAAAEKRKAAITAALRDADARARTERASARTVLDDGFAKADTVAMPLTK